MRPKFNVVLIGRNEEQTLPRLVGSLKEFQERGGKIYLLDTGSTDKTAEVARNLGCTVEEVGDKFAYIIDEKMADDINGRFIVEGEEPMVKVGDRLFDFASARNYAAEMSDLDIIATPDCDEIYTKLDIDKVDEVISNGVEQLEYNFVFSHDEYGNEGIKFMHCKFYNRKKLHWVGVVHEVLVGDAKKQFLSEDIIKLEHYQNEKTNRSGYLRGLALDCYLHPENDRNSHYLAREMMYWHRYRSAIKEFDRHIAMDKWPAERAQSIIYMGDCYGFIGNKEKQVECYAKAFVTDSSRPVSLVNWARMMLNDKNYQGAIALATASLTVPYNGYYGNDMKDYTSYPNSILYQSYGWLGNITEAQKHILKCLEFEPENSGYLRDLRFYFDLPVISIIIPHIQGTREEGLEKCLDSIKALNYPEEKIKKIIILGDETVPVKVEKGLALSNGEWIVFGADDIEFTPNSIILAWMDYNKTFRMLQAFDTGVKNEEGYSCEHFMIKRDLIGMIGGQIFDTDFHHCGVDDLLWKKAEKLSQQQLSRGKVIHHHFSRGGTMDETYQKGWSHVEDDRKLLIEKLKNL